jgi:hypothetical protein
MLDNGGDITADATRYMDTTANRATYSPVMSVSSTVYVNTSPGARKFIRVQ